MDTRKTLRQVMILTFGLLLAAALAGPATAQLTPTEQLGKELFFDANLSTPAGQSCASCHNPQTGFTGPDSTVNAGSAIYPGVMHSRIGDAKPPTVAYGGRSPILFYDQAQRLWMGGMAWDGSATGWAMDDPLADQAARAYVDPTQQNNSGIRQLYKKIAKSSYADLFAEVWGPSAFNVSWDPDGRRLARPIAAYLRSREVSAFTSKYDYYLAGQATLTPQETQGLALFEGKGNCATCHVSQPGPNNEPPLFTNYTYHNLGVPPNMSALVDTKPKKQESIVGSADGLGGFLVSTGNEAASLETGKQKVPTLRNVDLRPYPGFVKAYTHNGNFKSLEAITHFLSTRDMQAWPLSEVSVNVNTDVGNLGLTPAEEAAIVAFMRTLTDGFVP